MADKVKKIDTDVAIIGGGPGGCTLAKELSAKGKKVVLLEKGGDHKRFLGSVMGNF
ncbi:FAD-dependent oxidoreductase, partial [Chloroflexota bacterium]